MAGAAPGKITTRVFSADDVDSILQLLRVSLGEPPLLRRTRELFSWKHFENPFGPSIGLIAEADDRIVGLRAFMRWALQWVDGSIIQCVRAVDTATHPEYQRRGIFRTLTNEGLEIAAASGVDLVFNTPNEKSGPGYLEMGWRRVGPIGALVRPSWRWFSSAGEDTPPFNPERFLIHPEPAASSTLADREALGLRTVRSEEYRKWRFTAHPTARYFQIRADQGMSLVRPNIRRGRRELIIADVYGTASTAIRAAVSSSRSAYVAAWFSEGSPERRASVRAGLLPVPGLTPLTLMTRPLRDFDIDLTDLGSWDLSVADLELL